MAVTGFMQTLNILGVYNTHLQHRLSKNKIVFIAHPLDQPHYIKWWAQMDLNHRPRAYQARALTN